MNEILEKIKKIAIVPVVLLEDAKDARPLAEALCDGGLPCAEVTFRTEAAQEGIRVMTEEFPEMLVGAGTGDSCRSQIYCQSRPESQGGAALSGSRNDDASRHRYPQRCGAGHGVWSGCGEVFSCGGGGRAGDD